MKLTELLPEQKTRLLAELDGWTEVQLGRFGEYVGRDCRKNVFGKRVPDYLTSYDAIIPLIQKLDRKIVVRIILSFKAQNDVARMYDWLMFTPIQLCDAVLIATGKGEL